MAFMNTFASNLLDLILIETGEDLAGRDPLDPDLRALGGGGNERESLDPFRMLEEIEHGQQAAPGVAAQNQSLKPEVLAHPLEIGDVLPPSNWRVP